MNQPVKHNMYFVAIVCPEQINEKVEHFKQWMKDRFGCVVAMKSPAHITLIPPFWLAQERENELMNTILSFNVEHGLQKIELEGFSHFRKNVLYIQVKKNTWLSELKSLTEKHFMERTGDVIKKDDRPFHPHITIANRDMKPAHFEKAWEHFSSKEFSEAFDMNSISLLKLIQAKWNVIGKNG